MSDLTLIGIPGSLRRNAFSVGLLKAAQGLAPAGCRIVLGDIAGFPVFNQDEDANPPAPVRRLKEEVRAADAVLFSINEHNFGLSAAEKNVIDWLSRPPPGNVWDGKPAGIMSASTGRIGGARAQYELRQTMVTLNMFPINRPEVLVTFAEQKFDGEGNLTDAETRKVIASHLSELVRHTRLLGGHG
jgi:chromate reductase, NAD(P)H dehydrogenase (quinone)